MVSRCVLRSVGLLNYRSPIKPTRCEVLLKTITCKGAINIPQIVRTRRSWRDISSEKRGASTQ